MQSAKHFPCAEEQQNVIRPMKSLLAQALINSTQRYTITIANLTYNQSLK